MDDEYQRAIEIGQENADLIAMGKAWCTNIRTDRSGFGVGMVEQMTGLPITGGRFACDFAVGGGLAGMQLSASAVGFYEQNCRGCEHRAPGGRVPNLSTWAEPIIEGRLAAESEREEAERQESTDRRQRIDQRRLVASSWSAAGQEVAELISRLDLDPGDVDAAERLRAAAQLTPETFSSALKELLYTDARIMRSAVILDALITVEGDEDPPALHSLCLEGAREGWGRSEGLRHLTTWGVKSDLDDRLLDIVVLHAGPSGWASFRTNGDPKALIHYHSVDPETVESAISTLLRHGESWRRAGAAGATREIVKVDDAAGLRLLRPLLDGLRFHESWHNHDEGASQIGQAVALVLQAHPREVGDAVDGRWAGASREYRTHLVNCFDSLVRHATESLSADVAAQVLKHALKALGEPHDIDDYDFETDYQHRASDLLKMAVPLSPTPVLSTDALLGLLLLWLDREQELADLQPQTMTEAYEKLGAEARIGGLIRDIADAVTAVGVRDPRSFVQTSVELFAGTEHRPAVRAQIVRIAGRVAGADVQTNDALSLIYTAMLGDDQLVRAAGMDAAEQVIRALPAESVPPMLAEAVATGLADQYLIVVVAALRALHAVPADLLDPRRISIQLLVMAQAYATDRLHDSLVQDALAAAQRFIAEDTELKPVVQLAALKVVEQMPAYNARETLSRNRSLRHLPQWADAAIVSLRPDDDLQYESLGDRQKDDLLRALVNRSLDGDQLHALEVVEIAAGRHDRGRSLRSADLFAEFGRYEVGVRLLKQRLEEVPDTVERRGQRLWLEACIRRFELESVLASRDVARRDELSEQLEHFDSAAGDDW